MNDMEERVRMLEERVKYLESLIKANINKIDKIDAYDFDESVNNIKVTTFHLSQILKSNMEDQIIHIIVDHNKQFPFLKMSKELLMYKDKWVYLPDSDLKFLFITIEYKIRKLYSEMAYDNAEKYFEDNKIILGLDLNGKFKKIKNKLIDCL
jgi:hypothetical protein